MSFLERISVLILTYNEAPNIGRTLDALAEFSDVLVLDSGSTDATPNIITRYPNVRLATRPFDNHAAQWTYGLAACGLTREWVLALDADYVVSKALVQEIAQLAPTDTVGGYRVRFRYCVFGRPLSGTLYPPLIVLYRRDRATYVQTGHTQRVIVPDAVGDLLGRIEHDDRKPLSRWFASQKRYAELEARHLLQTPRIKLRRSSRIRLMAWPAPLLVFLYTLIVKGCILDGWPGWLYVLQRTLSEIMICIEIVDGRLRTEPANEGF